MKPGRLSTAGLATIMMILPDTLWKGAPPRATVNVVVRPADAASGSGDHTRRIHNVEADRAILDRGASTVAELMAPYEGNSRPSSMGWENYGE